MTVKAGQMVDYMPSQDYWLDTDSGGDLLFEIFTQQGGERYFGPSGNQINQRWLPATSLKPGKPLRAWKARVIAVYPDGSLALEVKHPNGCLTVFHNRVRQDDNQACNTWRLPREEAKKND
jgi:hypothetical protein